MTNSVESHSPVQLLGEVSSNQESAIVVQCEIYVLCIR